MLTFDETEKKQKKVNMAELNFLFRLAVGTAAAFIPFLWLNFDMVTYRKAWHKYLVEKGTRTGDFYDRYYYDNEYRQVVKQEAGCLFSLVLFLLLGVGVYFFFFHKR